MSASAKNGAKNGDSIFDMIKLGAILVCYAVASCTVLALVNSFTAPKILQNNIQKATKAMSLVFANADNFEQTNAIKTGVVGTITLSEPYLAKKDGKVIGAVVQASGATYDKAKIIVGVNVDGTISGIEFLEITDSPGFGLKANDPTFLLPSGKTFYGQFAGLSAKEPLVTGDNVEVISGATITTNGVVALVNTAKDAILAYFEEASIE